MLIVTNYTAFPSRWRAACGTEGETVIARGLAEFHRHARRRDAVFVINGDAHTVMALAFARMAIPGFDRPLVAIDLIFRRPSGLKGRLAHLVKRPLLARADLYINFFADARGVGAVYGIPPERCSYVPFKVNLDIAQVAHVLPTEEFVLCFGRSMRDYDTFFDAMARLPHPAAIADVNPADLAQHGARFTRRLEDLPANVCVLDDDGSSEAQLDMLRRAKLVVIPVRKASFVASGISTALNAMMVGKCVIGTEGPGMTDIFTEEILAVPPEDPAALAAMIDRAWNDDALRRRVSDTGRRCAERLGGEDALVQRLIDRIADTYG
ncbi:glycosyltransferase [Aquabacter spiritensis]|uniref:Glycosyl transferase family 1 n=1 Tax=Aquabacter spiritensis TaxID=933073 RepID=A0A4R3M3W4_9HYPH|nr:glycosyltransferase [Aquabacter spiritensis]TCT06017.1 glycosyl transferase family 1 [Aquabacter spiritensis]